MRIDEARKMRLDVTSAMELLKRARPALEKKDFELAYGLAVQSEEAACKVMGPQRAKALLTSTWERIKSLGESGMNIRQAEALIKKARTSMKVNNYEKAIDYIKEAEDLIAAQTESTQESVMELYQTVNEKLQSTWSKIQTFKARGGDTREAEGLFRQAREIVKTQDYRNALAYINNAEKLVSSPEDRLREDTEHLITNIRGLIDDTKSLGLDKGGDKLLLREAEKFLEKAETEFANKDFKYALADAEKSQTSIDQLEDMCKRKSAPDTISEADKTIKFAKEQGIDITYEKDLFKQATKAFKTGEYIKARNLAKKVLNSLEDTRKQQEVLKVSVIITPVANIIEDLKVMGGETSDLEKQLKSAETSLEKGRNDEAKKIAKAVEQDARKRRDQHIQEATAQQMRSLQESLESAKQSGQDTVLLEELFNKAEEKFNKFKFDEAREYAQRLEKLLLGDKEKKRADEAIAALRKSRNLILETDKMGLNIDEAKEVFKKAEPALKSKDYDRVIKLANEAEKSIKEVRSGVIMKNAQDLLSRVEASVEEARKKGADTSEADKLIEQAKSAMEINELDMLNQYLNEAEDITKNLLTSAQKSKMDKAMEIIRKTRNVLIEIRSMGADISEAEKYFKQAEPALRRHDLDEVISFTSKAQEEAQKAKSAYLKGKANDLIGQTRKLIEKAEGAGIDTSQVRSKLAEAETALEKELYSKVNEITIEANKMAQQLASEGAMSAGKRAVEGLKQARGRILEAKNLGLSIQDIEELYKKAEPLLREKDYDGVMKVIQKVNDGIDQHSDSLKKQQSVVDVSDLQHLIEEEEGKGRDVTKAKSLLEEAQKMLVEERVDEAEKLAEEIRTDLSSEGDKQVCADAIESMKEIIPDLKTLELNTTDMEKYLKKAEEFFSMGDFNSAMELARKSMAEASQAQKTVQVRDAMEAFQNLINETRDKGGNTASMEAILNDASMAMKTGDLSKALELIDRGMNQAS